MPKKIVVIDYGLGNLRSVTNALKKLGATVTVSDQPREIRDAGALILPGVGAFYRGMENLKIRGLTDLLHDEIIKGKPVLGICLGFQLLFTESQEHGVSQGLDLIRGEVIRFTSGVKIPHMGWNQIRFNTENSRAGETLFKNIPEESYFYFVHSYHAVPKEQRTVAATTSYGREFVSAIVKDNLYATQFHPERSGRTGLQVLNNFIELI